MHTALIGFIREALAEELPPDLTARAEERITVSDHEGEGRSYRADVAVIEPWRAGFPPVGTSADAGGGTSTLTVTEPLVFSEQRLPERRVEIRDVYGDVVTVLEVVSPANKTPTGWMAYDRRQHCLKAGVNVVEIDLVRGGLHVVGIGHERLNWPAGTCHVVCVTRPLGGEDLRREVYLCPLREPLPTIRVPLRRGDPDLALALQGLIDRCYRTGRYWLADTARPLAPPPADESENAWIEDRLRDPA